MTTQRNHRNFRLTLPTLALLLVSGQVLAQTGKPAAHALQNARTTAGGKADVAWGRTAKAYAGTPAEIAKRFMSERRTVRNAKANLAEDAFIESRQLAVPTGVLVDLQEQHNGLQVFNSNARVIVDAEGHVRHVTDESTAFTPPAGAEPTFDLATACELAEDLDTTIELRRKGALGLWIVEGRGRYAYRVNGERIADGKHTPYQMIIDAETGETLDRLRLVADQCFHGEATDENTDQTNATSLLPNDTYNIRLTLTEGTANTAYQAGIDQPILGDADYTIDRNTLANLKQLRLNPTITGGTTSLTARTTEPTGVAEAMLAFDANNTATLISGDNNGAGWDIPDEDWTAVGGTEQNAPAGSTVTGITFRLRISPNRNNDTFYAGDFEIMLASERMLNQDQGINVYGPVGFETDGGYDDDVEDDYDIFLDGWWSGALNGEPADQPLYIIVADRFAGDVGMLDYVEMTVEWTAGNGGPNTPDQPDTPQGPNVPTPGGVCTPNGATLVFDPNPITSAGQISGYIPNNAYSQVSLTDFLGNSNGGLYTLAGRFCEITDLETPSNVLPTSSTTEFGFSADDDCFGAVMCFYHISKSASRLQDLGFQDAMNGPVRVDHRGLNMDTNAYYTTNEPGRPGEGYMAFGNGPNGRPIAEDADVVYHEFGHAMQDNQSPGSFFREAGITGMEPGSISEGFGDYWAFSMTYDANMKGPFQDPESVGEWAWNGQPLRRTDSTKHYPEDLNSEVHDDGEMWAAALVEIFYAIGRESTDKVVVYSHYLVPTSGPTFADAANALIAADDQLYNGEHRNTIGDIMIKRGFISSIAGMPNGNDRSQTPESNPQTPQGPEGPTTPPVDAACGAGSSFAMMLTMAGLMGISGLGRRRVY